MNNFIDDMLNGAIKRAKYPKPDTFIDNGKQRKRCPHCGGELGGQRWKKVL